MIENIEKGINRLKRKINKKVLGVILFGIFGVAVIFSLEMTKNYKRQKDLLQDEYNKSLYLVVGYINNVESELAKFRVTSTNELMSVSLSNIWKQANLAKDNLEVLPVSQNSLSSASKYLSQVSDYSYVLMKKTISGEKLSEEENKNIDEIYENSRNLAKVLREIYDDLNNGRIKWDELEKIGNEKFDENKLEQSTINISKINKTFQEYEGLIYDGAFSDHLLSSTPKYLKDKEISSNEAIEYINNVFGSNNVEKITQKEDINGRLQLYNFDVKLKKYESIRNIQITKKDCKMYLMISNRNVEESKINMEEAKKIGKEFLKSLGIEDIKDTYYLTTENMATINYAAVQDNVTLYPDLIKVKIALDTGEICSVECQGYIFNHERRNNLSAKISESEAREVLNKNIVVQSSSLSVIPTESKSEILAYEFKGKIDDKEYLIYINASNKREERVLVIVNTPDGILTM